jgi:hypothetical protein
MQPARAAWFRSAVHNPPAPALCNGSNTG